MLETILIPEITCIECGRHIFTKSYAEKGLYICQADPWDDNNISNNYNRCLCRMFYCKTCKKFYNEDMLGKHGDVYECKECGTIHWGYTDMQRETDALYDALIHRN